MSITTTTAVSKEFHYYWPFWASLILFILMVFFLIWGYRQDKRDEIDLVNIRSEKKKVFVNANLGKEIIQKIFDYLL